MNTSIRPPATGTAASRRKIALYTLLLACLVATPVVAQQIPGPTAALVPENIAPHPAPEQPLPFSHQTHTAVMPVCQACHVNPDPGIQMTFPDTAICMTCHSVIARDRPAIETLHAYAASGQPIPWVRVYAIANGVTWSHRVHLDVGTECETCHGDIRQAESVAETRAVRAMATCISCHEAHAAPADCVSCHAWPTDQDLGFD